MHRYFMEVMGTFFLMFALTFTGNPLAIGLIYMAMIYIGGHVSGAHCNPAISTAMLLRNRMTFSEYSWYIVAQIIGGLLGALLFYGVSGAPFALDLPANANLLIISVPEFLLTFVLCLVFLTMFISTRFLDVKYHGIVPGLTLVAIGFFGGIFNPALALGLGLLNLAVGNATVMMQSFVVHVIAPLLAGAAAAYKYRYLNPNE